MSGSSSGSRSSSNFGMRGRTHSGQHAFSSLQRTAEPQSRSSELGSPRRSAPTCGADVQPPGVQLALNVRSTKAGATAAPRDVERESALDALEATLAAFSTRGALQDARCTSNRVGTAVAPPAPARVPAARSPKRAQGLTKTIGVRSAFDSLEGTLARQPCVSQPAAMRVQPGTRAQSEPQSSVLGEQRSHAPDTSAATHSVAEAAELSSSAPTPDRVARSPLRGLASSAGVLHELSEHLQSMLAPAGQEAPSYLEHRPAHTYGGSEGSLRAEPAVLSAEQRLDELLARRKAALQCEPDTAGQPKHGSAPQSTQPSFAKGSKDIEQLLDGLQASMERLSDFADQVPGDGRGLRTPARERFRRIASLSGADSQHPQAAVGRDKPQRDYVSAVGPFPALEAGLQYANAAPSLSATEASPQSSIRAQHAPALAGLAPMGTKRGPSARQLLHMGRQAPTAASSAISDLTALVVDPSSHRHAGPQKFVGTDKPAQLGRMRGTSSLGASADSSAGIRELVGGHLRRIEDVADTFLGAAKLPTAPTLASDVFASGTAAATGLQGNSAPPNRAEGGCHSSTAIGSPASHVDVLSDAAWCGHRTGHRPAQHNSDERG